MMGDSEPSAKRSSTEARTEVRAGVMRTFEQGILLGYHLLPLATINLVGDNREFEV